MHAKPGRHGLFRRLPQGQLRVVALRRAGPITVTAPLLVGYGADGHAHGTAVVRHWAVGKAQRDVLGLHGFRTPDTVGHRSS